MKTKSKVLIGIMALALAGGVSTAFALTINPANKDVAGSVDKAVYLYWGNGNTSCDIQNLDDLEKDQHQYRLVSVAPKTSTNLAGTVSVTFTLTAETDEEGKTPVLTGLTVKIFSADSTWTEANAHSKAYPASNAPTPLATLTSPDDLSYTASISVTASYSTTHYFAMDFVHDGTSAGDGNVFGGAMTISQLFTAA